ncbi:hypothetical protein NKDENANG_00556 [Candidatus Entotheonellaceae bacterium PAL068K]
MRQLINGAFVGPAAPIGQDYKVLEGSEKSSITAHMFSTISSHYTCLQSHFQGSGLLAPNFGCK